MNLYFVVRIKVGQVFNLSCGDRLETCPTYQPLPPYPSSGINMKSEERHKLQQNELADYLAKIVETLKPYQNAILGGIIVVLVAVLFLHWWNNESASAMEAANTQFYSAFSSGQPAELMGVVEKYPQSKVAVVAALMAADLHLGNGCNLLFQNRASANSELGKAVDIYQKLLREPVFEDKLLSAQATYGLARAKECQNKLPEAEKLYAEIVEKWPEGPYGVLAARRLEDVKRPATKENYDKFAKFDPKPFKDDSRLPGKMPAFDPNNMPKEGPLYTPGSIDEKSDGKTEKKDDLQENKIFKETDPLKLGQPATGEKKPDEAKPAEPEKPAAEPAKPAEGEQPTATPPATETPAPEKTPEPAEKSK
jgi:hypothetical protein